MMVVASSDTPGRSSFALLLIPILTAAGWLISLVLGAAWLLPVLNAAPACWFMLASLRRGDRRGAIVLMLWWALWLGIAGVGASLLWPARAEMVVFNGDAYREEMFAWLTTGQGRESSPMEFIPQHLLHAAIFVALSLATASTLSILMGCVLMNYMSFYVASLILHCSETPAATTAILLGWNPWSMVRVASFIILGVVLSEPLLSRMRGHWPDASGRRRWLLVAAAGLLVDIAMKTLLAPMWPGLLASCFTP